MKTSKLIIAGSVIIGLCTMAFTATNPKPEQGKDTIGDQYIPRNPKKDHLLTSENTVLLVIDWQDEMLGMVRNIDKDILTNNIQAIIKTANVFDIPVIESTIGVNLGANKPTVPSIKQEIESNVQNIDRISLNAWQNKAVVEAVKKTGRKKIIMTGLWTSGCPTYTALDALADGYEVYILADVMGDATTDAHNRAIDRMVQAGAIPFTWEGAGAEILRAYTHPKAMQDEKIEGGFVGIMKEHFYPFAGKY